jgi:hypothetical protein
MNWTKLTLLTGFAAAVVALPSAIAQDEAVAPVAAAPTQMSAPISPSVSESRPSSHWRGGSGEWRNRTGDRHRWGSGHHHHRSHRRYYGSRFYYSSYPFGYPYGWGFNIGRPFYGTAADYYFNGYYHPRYAYYDSGFRSTRSNQSIVPRLQQELAQAGFYSGPIDGVLGDGTRRAIRAYERANGLPVDGRIDTELLRAMGFR